MGTIITLTTDWGSKDFFSGMVKGKLLSAVPDAQIIDISHHIDSFNIPNAAFVVKQACLGFPAGTIHIIDVDSYETRTTGYVLVVRQGQYFICTDNGLLPLAFGRDYDEARHISVYHDSDQYTFVAYTLFCKVAAMIANGSSLDDIGEPIDQLVEKLPLSFIEMPDQITARICYIDEYGNAYLNISYEHFERCRKGRTFTIRIHEGEVREISDCYMPDDTTVVRRQRGLLLTVSATGLLQIAYQHSSAEQLFNLKVGENIIIRFS